MGKLYEKRTLVIMMIAGAGFFIVLSLFAFIGALAESMESFLYAGMGVAVLSVVWGFGEAAGGVNNGERKLFSGKGLKTVLTLIYLALIVLSCIIIQIILIQLAKIEGAELLFGGLFLAVNTLLSAIAILSIVALLYGIITFPFIKAIPQQESLSKKLVSPVTRIFAHVWPRLMWLRILLINPIATFLGSIKAIPSVALMGGGLFLTLFLGEKTGSAGYAAIARLPELLAGNLKNLEAVQQIGVFLALISISIVMGVAFAPILANLFHSYRRLYESQES